MMLLLDDDLIVSRIKASDDTILCNKYNRNRLQVSTAVFNRRIEISCSFERQIKIPDNVECRQVLPRLRKITSSCFCPRILACRDYMYLRNAGLYSVGSGNLNIYQDQATLTKQQHKACTPSWPTIS